MLPLINEAGGKARRLPLGLVLFVVTLAMMVAVTVEGARGAFWCYPAVIVSYLILSTRTAGVCSLILLAFASTVIGRTTGAGTAIRFAISLGLVIVSVSIMLNTLGDLQRKLAEQAITDPLTGAFNRRHLETCLTTAIERRNRTLEPSSLLLLDVDHFKAINDAFGHSAGDEVLKGIVRLVSGRMRALDVLFRIGGEEFALLLSGARYADALVVAEDLRLLIADADLLDARGVSISVGVSELQKGQSVHAWIGEADAALYRAKQGGRNRVAGRALANAC